MMLLWLIHHLIPTISFAATVMPSLGSDGTPGPLVSSGEGESTEGEPVEGELTEGEPVEGDEPAPQVQTAPKEGAVDWRTVPPEVKAHLSEMSKTNPKLANLLQNAVYTSNTFLKEIPGGIKEIRQIKKDIDDLGGMDEIRNTSRVQKALVDEQEDMDNRARAGDPSVIDNYLEIAGADGFSKLMTSAIVRWANSDNPAYSHEMSKVMVSALRDGGVVGDLNLAFKMLKLGTPDAVKEATECLNRCAEWANGINKLAVTPPVKPKIDPTIAQEQTKIDTQRTKLFNDEFSGTFGRWRQNEITREVTQISNGKTLTPYQMDTLSQRIIDDMKGLLTSDMDYMKNLERLYNARDLNDLLKFSKGRVTKLLPDVTKKAYRALFGAAPAPKKSASVKPDGKTTTAAVTPVKTAGWTKIDASKAPGPDQIDSNKTSFEMKWRKQAILKSGAKVYWGDAVPK